MDQKRSGRWAHKHGPVKVGDKFGLLLVVKEHKQRTVSGLNRLFWWCDCDCGNAYLARDDHLRREAVKSCGCSQFKPTGRRAHNAKPPGHYVARAMWTGYRIRAQKKGVAFSLTLEQFVEIAIKPCFYCGDAPKEHTQGKLILLRYAPENRWTNGFVCNGIDRIEPALGYVEGNAVACCWTCNRAKGELSISEFLEWADRLGRYQHDVAANSTDPHGYAKGKRVGLFRN